jgi:hypothetical protein
MPICKGARELNTILGYLKHHSQYEADVSARRYLVLLLNIPMKLPF